MHVLCLLDSTLLGPQALFLRRAIDPYLRPRTAPDARITCLVLLMEDRGSQRNWAEVAKGLS